MKLFHQKKCFLLFIFIIFQFIFNVRNEKGKTETKVRIVKHKNDSDDIFASFERISLSQMNKEGFTMINKSEFVHLKNKASINDFMNPSNFVGHEIDFETLQNNKISHNIVKIETKKHYISQKSFKNETITHKTVIEEYSTHSSNGKHKSIIEVVKNKGIDIKNINTSNQFGKLPIPIHNLKGADSRNQMNLSNNIKIEFVEDESMSTNSKSNKQKFKEDLLIAQELALKNLDRISKSKNKINGFEISSNKLNPNQIEESVENRKVSINKQKTNSSSNNNSIKLKDESRNPTIIKTIEPKKKSIIKENNNQFSLQQETRKNEILKIETIKNPNLKEKNKPISNIKINFDPSSLSKKNEIKNIEVIKGSDKPSKKENPKIEFVKEMEKPSNNENPKIEFVKESEKPKNVVLSSEEKTKKKEITNIEAIPNKNLEQKDMSKIKKK